MIIILIRHAETEGNKKGIVQSLDDSKLTRRGLEQVNKIINFLKNYHVGKIFSSELGRALETAQRIAADKNLKVITDKRLNEINWGEYTGLPTKELFKKWNKQYKEELKQGKIEKEIRPEVGENTYDHMKRVNEFLDEIRKDTTQNIIIVAHSGTNKVILGLLQGKNPEEFYKIKQDNACINILKLNEKGELTESKINITNHLHF